MVTSNLEFLRGLSRLGHDVYFVEDSEDYESCYDPVTMAMSADPTYGMAFARRAFERIGLGDSWSYYDAHTTRWLGPCADRILDVCASADLLLNLCGVNPLRPWLMRIPARVFVDEDPAFTQIRHLTDPAARDLALRHTAFFTFAENFGCASCQVPDDGLPWKPTRQPIVLDGWPVTSGPEGGRFTTVMQWDSYPALQYLGQRYGLKCETLVPYVGLPRHVGRILEVAIARLPEDGRTLLQQNGWFLRDPRDLSRNPWSYRRYLQRSKSEFSVAKHGYVVSRSGWFSERSACYLASGRPVVVQDTGFSDSIGSGTGVLAFRNPEEAQAAIEEVNRRYRFHCRGAREVAEEYFDARKILPSLVARALNAQPASQPKSGVR